MYFKGFIITNNMLYSTFMVIIYNKIGVKSRI
nr:MAG TPA: hypothetical protein [Caudoviricetes sp.]